MARCKHNYRPKGHPKTVGQEVFTRIVCTKCGDVKFKRRKNKEVK